MIRFGLARRTFFALVAASSYFASPQLAAQSLDQLSGRDATAGLRAALDKGAAAAVASLGRTDGFWANPKVKIPLPEHLQRARTALSLWAKATRSMHSNSL